MDARLSGRSEAAAALVKPGNKEVCQTRGWGTVKNNGPALLISLDRSMLKFLAPDSY
jgi:hypothetical protein